MICFMVFSSPSKYLVMYTDCIISVIDWFHLPSCALLAAESSRLLACGYGTTYQKTLCRCHHYQSSGVDSKLTSSESRILTFWSDSSVGISSGPRGNFVYLGHYKNHWTEQNWTECVCWQMGIIDFSLYLHDTPLLQAKTPMEMR